MIESLDNEGFTEHFGVRGDRLVGFESGTIRTDVDHVRQREPPGVYFLNTKATWEYFCMSGVAIADTGFGANTVAVLVVEP